MSGSPLSQCSTGHPPIWHTGAHCPWCADRNTIIVLLAQLAQYQAMEAAHKAALTHPVAPVYPVPTP